MLNEVITTLNTIGVTGEITEETTLAELGLDSIMVLELVVALEERLGFSFEDTDLVGSNFHSVGTIVAVIEKYASKA